MLELEIQYILWIVEHAQILDDLEISKNGLSQFSDIKVKSRKKDVEIMNRLGTKHSQQA